jgi:predicted nuclease of predicted toxin-antitoxin system
MSRPIRYVTDEHVPQAIPDGLRKRGVDVVTTAEVELLGADDEEILSFARREQRVVVTQDQDFLQMAAEEGAHGNCVCSSGTLNWANRPVA